MRGFRVEFAVLVAVVLLFLAQLEASYQARVRSDRVLHISLVAGCQRGVSNASDMAEFAYAAYQARSKDARDPAISAATRAIDRMAAQAYLTIAQDLNQRTYGRWSVTWPYVSPHARTGTRHYPIGVGTLNCEKAYPSPHESFLQLF